MSVNQLKKTEEKLQKEEEKLWGKKENFKNCRFTQSSRWKKVFENVDRGGSEKRKESSSKRTA